MDTTKNNNLLRSLLWTLLIGLILGSYGYTSWSRNQTETQIKSDLARIESKVDEINRYLRDNR